MPACLKCGEELLGAVNRCWRCGEMVAAERSAPIVATEVVAATAIPLPESAATPTRVGSPFSDSAAVVPAIPPVRERAPVRNRTRTWALGGGIGSLLLGIISLFATWYVPYAALVTSVLGMIFGVWGLYAEKRGPAVIGLLLCCIALAISGFITIIAIYTYFYEYSPLDALPPPSLNP